jgi:hypothetical protein
MKHTDETKQKIALAKIGNSWNKGKRHRPETIEKMRASQQNSPKKGKSLEDQFGIEKAQEIRAKQRNAHKNQRPNWKGGITPLNQKIRQSIEYKLWRDAVFMRDNYQCVWGGKEHGDRLHADHIQLFSTHPELRFAIDNGRTLCVSCHQKRHSKK